MIYFIFLKILLKVQKFSEYLWKVCSSSEQIQKILFKLELRTPKLKIIALKF